MLYYMGRQKSMRRSVVEKIHISLSDSSSVAIAYAVAEGKENTCQSDVRSHKDYESAQK